MTEPIRVPFVQRWGCNGGLDLDRGYRPWKHASVGRNNWKRTFRKRQRRAWRRACDETED